MGLIETFTLLLIGFVTFFATGIDDTMAYAGSYLHNRQKDHKRLISLGIIIGTLIALGIAISAGSLMEALPSKHLISGAVLVTLGIIMVTSRGDSWHHKKAHIFKLKKHIKRSRSPDYKNIKFVGLGMILFFGTGIDDLIAYSNLMMVKGSWLAISIGVLLGTFVSLIIAHLLADKLKKFPHAKIIGGVMIIIIGILLALKIL